MGFEEESDDEFDIHTTYIVSLKFCTFFSSYFALGIISVTKSDLKSVFKMQSMFLSTLVSVLRIRSHTLFHSFFILSTFVGSSISDSIAHFVQSSTSADIPELFLLREHFPFVVLFCHLLWYRSTDNCITSIVSVWVTFTLSR